MDGIESGPGHDLGTISETIKNPPLNMLLMCQLYKYYTRNQAKSNLSVFSSTYDSTSDSGCPKWVNASPATFAEEQKRVTFISCMLALGWWEPTCGSGTKLPSPVQEIMKSNLNFGDTPLRVWLIVSCPISKCPVIILLDSR